MKRFPILLIFCLCIYACKETSVVTPTPTPTLPNNVPLKNLSYLALGDSYTIGQSVMEQERYPIQLGNRLMPNTNENKEIRIIAKTGWTTDELQSAIDATTDLKPKYDLVSLLIGVNNQYRGYPLAGYQTEFRVLLEQAIQFAGNDTSRVFVVSIPDYAYTPFGRGDSTISQGIDDFNAVNRTITEEYGISYFDITPISREGLANPALVASDKLHPSALQYQQWVDLMEDSVKMMFH